jgi:isovaleryl-CoA dehydrogenase
LSTQAQPGSQPGTQASSQATSQSVSASSSSQSDWKTFNLFDPTDEHRMLRETVRQFVQTEVEPQAESFDRDEKFNLELFRKLGELGLLGITVDAAYGGSEMDATAAVIVHEEISASDPGFCLAYLAHAMLCVNNLSVNGSLEQKKRLLPGLCSGQLVGCMAMSEAQVGTDVLGMETRAVKQDSGYMINGRKMWITNGTIDNQNTPADVVWLYAKTGSAKTDVSSFIIEKSFKGYEVGQKIKNKLGMRASNTTELIFNNCLVPFASMVGQENDSLKHMMHNLEVERVTLAAMSLGIARRSLQVMQKYATERTAFGKTLSHFGQIQKYIAESFADYQAARVYVYDTARKLQTKGNGNPLDSDGVKLVASTAAKNIADRAIQVLGGYGYVAEYVVERLWRDSKLLEIGGGTLEAHQKNICGQLAKNSSRLYE